MAANQTKAWFEANRAAYEHDLKQPLAALVARVAAACAERQLPLTGDAKRSLFRIHRDVRFSRNKAPYKTNAGAVWFRPGGGKAGSGVLYCHIADEGCFMAAAFYLPDPGVLGSLREAIRVRPEAFLAMRESLSAAGLSLVEDGGLTRMPRGFEDLAGSPVAPYLKLRSFVIQKRLTHRQVTSPGLSETLADFAADALPLLNFGWRAIDEVDAG